MSDNSNTTSPVPAPTPADLARDLAADLLTVEAATPGPWMCRVEYRQLQTGPCAGKKYELVDVGSTSTRRYVAGGQLGIPAEDVEECRRTRVDMTAIAAMREAWPAAICRTIAAEAECERLRAALDDLWHFYDDPGAGSLPKTVARRVCEALGRPVPEHYQGDEWDG